MSSPINCLYVIMLILIRMDHHLFLAHPHTHDFLADNPNYPFYYLYNHGNQTFVKRTKELPADAPSLSKDFLTAPPNMPFKSHSQFQLQDMLILEVFNDKSNGYFVDLAANDWSHLSNSFVLEYYNKWRGVCIEPDPSYLIGLLSHRKCAIFVNPVSSSNGDKIKFNFAGPFGGIVGNDFDNKHVGRSAIDLYTITLTSVLDFVNAPTVIDYMSLDVEGAEWHVMSSFNFTKYVFLTITIERPTSNLHQLLVIHGYRFVAVISEFGECLYFHHSLKNFMHQMNKRHNGHNIMWYDTPHRFLLHPKWNGTYYDISHIHAHNNNNNNSSLRIAQME